MMFAIRPLVTAIAVFGLAAPATAQMAPPPEETTADMVEVDAGERITIYRHNVCRRVKNAGNTPFMVPVNSSSEWTGGSGFIPNSGAMPNVLVTPCFPSGMDLAFCYYTNTGGGYGDYFCGNGNESPTPTLRFTSGDFSSSLATMIAIKDANGPAYGSAHSILNSNGASRCVSDASGGELDRQIFAGRDPLWAYDEIKDDIYWPAGVRWCLAYGWRKITDHQMGGGDSGTGYDAAVSVMRIWNPNAY